MAYSNSSLKVHGPGCLNYTQRPPFTVNISVSDVSRSGNTISCNVTASLNGLGGASYFGYNIHLYAQLDNGSLVEIATKGNTPRRWSSGYGSLGTKTISSINSTTSCTLNLWLSSNCPCHGGSQKIVQSIGMSAPTAVKYTLTLNKGTGVASFTGGGTFDGGSTAATTVTSSPGYTLSKYVGTTVDGATGTWTGCAGKTAHNTTWSMVRDRTVTAYATGNSYTIRYNANGGSGTMTDQSVTYGSTVTPKTNTFTRANFTFIGWNTQPNGSGTNRNSAWTYDTVGDLTLYAQWARIPYTVSYNANGGSGAPAAQTKYAGVNLTLTTAKPTTAKKITVTFNANGGSVNPTSSTKSCGFLRWNTKADGSGTNYSSGGTYTANANATLYAVWSSISVDLPTPTRANCKFVGWFTAVNGGQQVTSSTTFSKDTTIYARWDYIISYNLNGGYVGDSRDTGTTTIPDSVKHHNENLVLTDIRPSKENLVFKGWAESASSIDVKYAAGGTYTANEPKTLYAVYGSPTYTVKFDLRGGTYTGGGALVQTVTRGQNATLPNNPTKAEHVFKGWIGDYTNITRDTVIYALWNGSPVWIKKSDGKWHSYTT